MKQMILSALVLLGLAAAASAAPDPTIEKQFLSKLDAPLLFIKRHSYTGIHIYDTYYKWPPGGGGIYVLENPAAPRGEWKIRPVIDPTTPGTLGLGVYTHPELSWDAKKVIFCFKGEPTGSTSIYEIGIDGKNLRRLTDPTTAIPCYKGVHAGQHDIAPAYLPDGRIVFLSTRPSGLVPCANEGVSILHVMNADGSDIHPISVNNVNEFDPSILPDGRILFGRWEYVDKNALTIQSLWTIHPDGTEETAVYANNMVLPEAILDARPVPGSGRIVATLAKHNATPRGSIAFIDPQLGKNNPGAIENLEHPDNPTFDRGDSCEPWPVSEDVVIFSGRPKGQKRNILEMIDRAGHRMAFMSDPDICLHSPMLVKPRPTPVVIADVTNRKAKTGRFFVQDIYKGLTGVKPGEVKYLRVIEETSRISASPGGKQPYNQTFLVSAALAFSCKIFHGVVPVDETGSAYFEAPAGRALYLQALDADGRLVQSMRTFIQAAPGATRSCIGCHEHKSSTPANLGTREVLRGEPAKLKPESWGNGYMDYPSMVQPILDKHCISCHGGEKGFKANMDLTGGWTEHFSISYANLVNRRDTQLIATLISGIDCMNGTAHWSCQIFQPRKHGTGDAPLAKVLMSGHKERIPNLTRTERDLLFAWIDSNGLYHGSWDYTKHGCAIRDWDAMQGTLKAQMAQAGCMKCHSAGRFEEDWVNLKDPTLSRILRAPLAKGSDGLGAEICRDRAASPDRRLTLLIRGYAHAIQPVEFFAKPTPATRPADTGEPRITFASSADPNYQAMLQTIRAFREKALASPRQDMPGAEILPGKSRQFVPAPIPDPLPALVASITPEGTVELTWERSAATIGLDFEVHRSDKENFTTGDATMVASTPLFRITDRQAPAGKQYYALVLISDSSIRSKPIYAAVTVPPPPPPPVPAALKAAGAPGSVRLRWEAPAVRGLTFNVYRTACKTGEVTKLNSEPIALSSFSDGSAEPQALYSYAVRAVSARGIESANSTPATGSALPAKDPVFVASFADTSATTATGEPLAGKLHGKATAAGGVLDLSKAGHITFPHREEFDLAQPITVELWAYIEPTGQMPIPVSCGHWKQAGWFLQRIGGKWRWHVGGIDCDGGKPPARQWMHLACTYDGQTARVYQDGQLVGEQTGSAVTIPFSGDLHIGQYSGGPTPDFQVTGKLAALKLYHRALSADDVAAAAKNRPAAAKP